MYNTRAKHIDIRRLAAIGLILACFAEVLVAQTFNYSRGWTNGKRRSPVLSALADQNKEPAGLDIRQMQRLKRLIELSHCCEQSQPREIYERADDDFNHIRRKVGFDRLSFLNSLPRAKI